MLLTRIIPLYGHSLAGQEEKAHAEAKEVVRINPKFSVDGFANTALKGYKGDQRNILITPARGWLEIRRTYIAGEKKRVRNPCSVGSSVLEKSGKIIEVF